MISNSFVISFRIIRSSESNKGINKKYQKINVNGICFDSRKLKKKNDLLSLIDDYDVDGDFVESQAFAYLAIRSYLKLPISLILQFIVVP